MDGQTTLDRTAFITFYSFKGGVGRSMALVNVAGIVAGRGFKVLAIDMDLEAPGISYLMRQESPLQSETQQGFVDLLADACDRGEAADLFALAPRDVVGRYSSPYPLPDEIRRSDEGGLHIMPAGRFDGQYQKRLDDLNLGRLYRDGQGQPLIAAFKKVITDAGLFDLVFIDSRTGFSDESGICTRDLADYLVVVMGLNRQNQEGTADFLRSLKQGGAGDKDLRIVLSPVPNGEDELVDQREKQARTLMKRVWGKPIKFSLQIPYHPRLALTEEPHIFRRSRGYLYDSYVSIEREVLEMMGLSVVRIVRQIEKADDGKNLKAVLKNLHTLAKLDRGPDRIGGIALRLLENSEVANSEELLGFLSRTIPAFSWELRRCAEQLHLKKNKFAALFYERLVANSPKDANHLGNYANFLCDERKDFDRAEEFYQRAIAADPEHASNLGNYATFLRFERKDIDRAEEFYRRAIAADPEDAIHLGNYAGFLFSERRSSEAEGMLDRSWKAPAEAASLRCELHFYAYAHLWQTRPEALPALKRLLADGARSEGWNFDENVRVAVESGHPHPGFLAELARVISGAEQIPALERFEVWKQAGAEEN